MLPLFTVKKEKQRNHENSNYPDLCDFKQLYSVFVNLSQLKTIYLVNTVINRFTWKTARELSHQIKSAICGNVPPASKCSHPKSDRVVLLMTKTLLKEELFTSAAFLSWKSRMLTERIFVHHLLKMFCQRY